MGNYYIYLLTKKILISVFKQISIIRNLDGNQQILIIYWHVPVVALPFITKYIILSPKHMF